MPRDYKTLDQRIGSLSERKQDIGRQLTALNRKLDTRRKIIAGGVLFARAKVDPDFAKQLCGILEKHLAPKDRGILTELMEEWRWPSGRV